VSAKPAIKKKHLGSLLFIPRLFYEYSWIYSESTFSRHGYCYDLSSWLLLQRMCWV